MGVGVFIVAIFCLGVIGVYMYYRAETNSYQVLVDRIVEVDAKVNANGDSISKIQETLESQKITNEHISSVSRKTSDALDAIDKELEALQEHLASVRESHQSLMKRPVFVELTMPKTAIPVAVTSIPMRRKVSESETSVVKSKTGIIHKSKSRSLERSVGPKKTLPGLRESKHTLKAMDL